MHTSKSRPYNTGIHCLNESGPFCHLHVFHRILQSDRPFYHSLRRHHRHPFRRITNQRTYLIGFSPFATFSSSAALSSARSLNACASIWLAAAPPPGLVPTVVQAPAALRTCCACEWSHLGSTRWTSRSQPHRLQHSDDHPDLLDTNNSPHQQDHRRPRCVPAHAHGPLHPGFEVDSPPVFLRALGQDHH